MILRGEQIGKGSQKRVYEDGVCPEDRVRAEFHTDIVDNRLTVEEIKSIYYLNKIANLLFPENWPDIYEAGMKPSKHFVAQRLEVDSMHKTMSDITVRRDENLRGINVSDRPTEEENDFYLGQDEKIKARPEVTKFVEKVQEAGIAIDSSGRNFSFREDGEVQYLDLDTAFSSSPDFLENID